MKIVYDFSDRYPDLVLTPFLFIIIGFGYFFYNKKHFIYNQVTHFGVTREYAMITGFLLGTVGIIISIYLSYYSLSLYIVTKNIYESKNYSIVEGHVINFKPMPFEGHADEKFDVKNIHFNYSDYDESDYGYNNTRSHGGAIMDSLYVRITYTNQGGKNVILRLEVK